jgi:hypothetical protein
MIPLPDAQTFATDVCEGVLEIANVSKKQLVRVEKRTMTPGRLSRVIKELDQLNTARLNKDEAERKIRRISHELRIIQRDLSPQEMERLNEILPFENPPPFAEVPGEDSDVRVEMPRVARRAEPMHVLVGNEESVEPDGSKRLRYHNTFIVERLR